MAQFLSSLASLKSFIFPSSIFKTFSTSSHDSKRPITTMHYNKRVAHVVEGSTRKYDVSQWVAALQDPDHRPEWLKDLESCKVHCIKHYRGTGSTPHEFIAVQIKTQTDERYIKIDRYTGPRTPPSDSSLPSTNSLTDSSNQTSDFSRKVAGTGGQYDQVEVMDDPQLRVVCKQNKYEVVQEVILGPGMMDVVDCAALVDVITLSSRNYSLFRYMCWWYSAVFFRTVVTSEKLHKITKGPAFNDQGRLVYGRIRKRMVGDNCELILKPDDDYTTTVERLAEVVGVDTEEAKGIMKKDQERQKEGDMLTGMVRKYKDHKKLLRRLIQESVTKVQEENRQHWLTLETKNLTARCEEVTARCEDLTVKNEEVMGKYENMAGKYENMAGKYENVAAQLARTQAENEELRRRLGA